MSDASGRPEPPRPDHARSEPGGATVRVRRAGEGDVPALAALRRTWAERREGGSPGADPGFEQAFTSWWQLEASRRAFWIAEVDDEHGRPGAVGSLNVVEVGAMPTPGHAADRWGYVGNLVVPSGTRVRGVPRVLLGAAIAHARERRYARLVLRPSAASTAFYRAAGFRPAGEDMMVLEPRREDGR